MIEHGPAVWQMREGWCREEKSHFVAFFLILLGAIGLRACFLFQPMRCDESFTFVHYASQPLAVGLSDYSYPNNHVFHTLLVHFAYTVFGDTRWAIRLPAFIAGVLMVPASYLFARLFYDKQVGLCTAGLVAVSSALVEYSTNARGYTLVCLFFLLLLSLATILRASAHLTSWTVFAILSALGFYTIPVMLYPFGVAVSWLLLSSLCEPSPVSRAVLVRNLVLSCFMTGVLTAALYMPVLLASGWKVLVGNPFVTAKPFTEFISQLPDTLRTVWALWNRDIPTPLGLLLIAGCALSLVRHRALSPFRTPVVAAGVVWLVPLLFIQRVVPWARIWLFLLPVYLALCSAGLVAFLHAGVAERWSTWATGTIMLATLTLAIGLGANVVVSQTILSSTETGALPATEAITRFLQGTLRHGDRLVAQSPSFETLEYYFLRHGVSMRPFFADVRASCRVLVIVNKTVPQDVEMLLASAAVPRAAFGMPQIMREFASATIYCLTSYS